MKTTAIETTGAENELKIILKKWIKNNLKLKSSFSNAQVWLFNMHRLQLNLLFGKPWSFLNPADGILGNDMLSCCSGHFVWTPVSTQGREQLVSDLIISCSQSLSNSITLVWHNTVSAGYLTCAVKLISSDKSVNYKPFLFLDCYLGHEKNMTIRNKRR